MFGLPRDATPVTVQELEELPEGAPLWFRIGLSRELQAEWSEWQEGTLKRIFKHYGHGYQSQYGEDYSICYGVNEAEGQYEKQDIQENPHQTVPEPKREVSFDRRGQRLQLCHRPVGALALIQLDF
jgi:hypothetical protein